MEIRTQFVRFDRREPKSAQRVLKVFPFKRYYVRMLSLRRVACVCECLLGESVNEISNEVDIRTNHESEKFIFFVWQSLAE